MAAILTINYQSISNFKFQLNNQFCFNFLKNYEYIANLIDFTISHAMWFKMVVFKPFLINRAYNQIAKNVC